MTPSSTSTVAPWWTVRAASIVTRVAWVTARSTVMSCSCPDDAVAAEDPGQQAADARAGRLTGGEDVGTVDRHVADPGRVVRRQRQTEHLEARVVGGDRLEHGRHADEVAADRRGHADLRRRLELRAVETDVHALGQVELDG